MNNLSGGITSKGKLNGSLAIGKGEQGPVGPVGPQGPIGDNNVCIGLSPTSEAEIWFDTNDGISGEEIATKKFVESTNEELSSRLDNLIISNGNGNKDSELVDARNGETTLGNKIRKIDESLEQSVKFKVVGEGITVPPINGDGSYIYDDTEIRKLINETNASLDNMKNDVRKFKPKVYAYMSQGASGSVNWETYVDEETYREHLRAMKKAGVDGFAFCLQIQPSKDHRDGFASGTVKEDELYYRAYPSLENVKLVAQLGEEEGIPLVGFKFHNNWYRENKDKLTFSKFMTQYENEAYKFADVFPSNKVKYFPIFNESPSIINVTENKGRIKTLVDQLRKRGYITGFAGHKGVDYDYDNYMNGIFYHVYPEISNKGERTTYVDGVHGWESSEVVEKLLRFREQYPTQTIIISESGCQNYWQSLANPELGTWSTGVWDNTGTPSAIYFKGLFEILGQENLDFLDSVWLFYTNPILEKAQKVIRSYTCGGEK